MCSVHTWLTCFDMGRQSSYRMERASHKTHDESSDSLNMKPVIFFCNNNTFWVGMEEASLQTFLFSNKNKTFTKSFCLFFSWNINGWLFRVQVLAYFTCRNLENIDKIYWAILENELAAIHFEKHDCQSQRKAVIWCCDLFAFSWRLTETDVKFGHRSFRYQWRKKW